MKKATLRYIPLVKKIYQEKKPNIYCWKPTLVTFYTKGGNYIEYGMWLSMSKEKHTKLSSHGTEPIYRGSIF